MFDICVLGSLNMDLVINVEKIPAIGETILAQDFKKVPGGKGANQAVAAARLKNRVVMLGCVGNDDNGNILVENMKKDGIETKYIKTIKDIPTGIALITVDSLGNNTISVYAGANMNIKEDDIDSLKDVIINSNIIIAQFETPVETTIKAFKLAKEHGKITILNPAPARRIPNELIKLSDIIVPNETETEIITGINPADDEKIKTAAKSIIDKGAEFVIITLGSRGAAIVSKDNYEEIAAYKVDAVDTTAAGDSFIGGIASFLSKKGLSFDILCSAVKFANKVSAIAVTRQGAQSSLPYLNEVYEKYGEEI
ncbi:ribokinase [Caloramator quimbayensis]|uniref:Ribokinase n=1 Tax=Caloramator quimbayensis TaxID=1147123 RepID=A0A1T4WKS4_9CLOT|nr:ribokinase [Caloramator quimbayensis]SKA77757.1 ribokinase [Caloramator quimbayensis]